MRIAAALLLIVLSLQEADVRALIEKLRSEDISVREGAFNNLKALGDSASAELEKAAKDRDPEVASRAKKLLHLIEVRRQLTPNLKALIPGVEERLAFGEPNAWTKVFIEVTDWKDARWLKLKRQDLDCLAGRALEFVTPEDQYDVLSKIGEHRLRSAVPALLKWKEPLPWNIPPSLIQDLGCRERAIPWLVGFLGHSDPRTRYGAIELLKDLVAYQAGPQVALLLKDEDEAVREHAAFFFWSAKCPEAVPPLLKLLDDPSPSVRWYAMEALAVCAPEEALPRILKQAMHQDPEVREHVAWALSDYPSGQAATTVLGLLKDDVDDVRLRALSTLAAWNLQEAYEAVRPFTADPESGVRWAAIRALIQLDRGRALPEIRKLLDHDNVDVRITAVGALGSAGDPECAKRFAALLLHENSGLRRAAMWALPKIEAPEHLPAMVAFLEASDGDEYEDYLKALKEVKWRGSVPALLRILDGRDSRRIRGALELLEVFKPVDAAPRITEFLKHGDAGIRAAAVSALGRIGAKETVPEILKVLKDGDLEVQEKAIYALGNMKAGEAWKDLLPFLKPPKDRAESELPIAAMWTLGELKRREPVPQLLPLLDHPPFRWKAFEALSKINDPSAYPAMTRLLDDLVHENRVWAARTFGNIRAVPVVPQLVPLLRDENDDLREAAITALGQIASPDAVAGLISALGDRHAPCRMYAARWLRLVDDKGLLPRVAKLLKDPDPSVRGTAADTLAWLGTRDGAETALTLGTHLTGLNFLRRPEVSRRLKAARLAGPVRGTPEVILAQIGKAAGLPSGVAGTATPPGPAWLRETQTIDFEEFGASLMELLDFLVLDSPYAVVVEADRIQLLHREEAVAFWKAWLAETK